MSLERSNGDYGNAAEVSVMGGPGASGQPQEVARIYVRVDPQPAPQSQPGEPSLKVFTVEETAEFLRVGVAKVWSLFRGELRSFKIGSRRLTTSQAIEEYVKAQEEKEATGGEPWE